MTVKELFSILQTEINKDVRVMDYDISYIDFNDRDCYIRTAKVSERYEELILE